MAKLHFKYGAMNAGKTTILIQTAYNYEEKGLKIFLIKSIKDTKGDDYVITRTGLKRKVDLLLPQNDSIIEHLYDKLDELNCILVDEAQFLSSKQVEELFYISKVYDIPVIAYSLRTDFKSYGFEGSIRLMELADDMEEIYTICSCQSKARFNARKRNGEYVTNGDQVVIDGQEENIEYEPLCGKCYAKKVLKLERGVRCNYGKN